MIAWKSIDRTITMRERRRWVRSACATSSRESTCLGYSIAEDDDEPCDICKACSKLGIEVE